MLSASVKQQAIPRMLLKRTLPLQHHHTGLVRCAVDVHTGLRLRQDGMLQVLQNTETMVAEMRKELGKMQRRRTQLIKWLEEDRREHRSFVELMQAKRKAVEDHMWKFKSFEKDWKASRGIFATGHVSIPMFHLSLYIRAPCKPP